MKISAEQIRNLFAAAGTSEFLFLPGGAFRLPDRNFETCGADFVLASFADCLDSLPQELVTMRQLGGGKSVRVMRHTMQEGDETNEAGDCDSGSVVLWAHAIVGNWRKAVRTKTSRGGLALGPLDYVAIAKLSGILPGGHDRLWFVDHDLTLRFFDVFLGTIETMERVEMESVNWGRAA